MEKNLLRVYILIFTLVAINVNCESTPLMEASSSEDLAKMKLIIEAGYPVDQFDRDGWTALHYAARFGKIKALELLIQKGADVNKLDMLYEDAPLHHAIIGNHISIVGLLLKHGANPNIRSGTVFQDGRTPLFKALENPFLVKLLLKYGADPGIVDKNGHSVMDIALRQENNEVIQLLKEHQIEKRAFDLSSNWQTITSFLETTVMELNGEFEKIRLPQLPENSLEKDKEKEKDKASRKKVSPVPSHKANHKKQLDLTMKKEDYKKMVKKVIKTEHQLPKGYDLNPLMDKEKKAKTDNQSKKENDPEIQQTINGISKRIASWENGTRLIVYNRGPKPIIITSISVSPYDKKNKKSYTRKTSIFIRPGQRINIHNVSHGAKDRFNWSFKFKVLGQAKEYSDPLATN